MLEKILDWCSRRLAVRGNLAFICRMLVMEGRNSSIAKTQGLVPGQATNNGTSATATAVRAVCLWPYSLQPQGLHTNQGGSVYLGILDYPHDKSSM